MELVPGRGRGCEDGVPDYGFGGGFRGAVGGVDGFEVEEDLFGVPVEEGGEVYGEYMLACEVAGEGEVKAYQHPGRSERLRIPPSCSCSSVAGL